MTTLDVVPNETPEPSAEEDGCQGTGLAAGPVPDLERPAEVVCSPSQCWGGCLWPAGRSG